MGSCEIEVQQHCIGRGDAHRTLPGDTAVASSLMSSMSPNDHGITARHCSLLALQNGLWTYTYRPFANAAMSAMAALCTSGNAFRKIILEACTMPKFTCAVASTPAAISLR